jgi:lysine 6-dehydrogenase
MKMLVLGAGLQGSACAFDLLRNPAVECLTIADLHPDRLPDFISTDDPRLKPVVVDAQNHDMIRGLMVEHDVAMSAFPYYFNGPMAKLAVEGGCHFCDLGGNTEIVVEQKELDAPARASGVSVIPDCGLAPGMVNILAAEGIRRLDSVERVKIFVGGLPQNPEPPLNYQIVYSLEGALDYYTTPSWVLRDGSRQQVDALSEPEPVDFPEPLGTLEAFHTGGGISLMPWQYEGKVGVMEYKTLRYPGHMELMRSIRELGLLNDQPIDVKGQQVVPRDVFIAAVSPLLTKPEGHDLVALRIDVGGMKNGVAKTSSWQLIDHYDGEHGISAMMRATGYSLSITGQLQAEGRIELGVHTPDEAVPYRAYVDALAERGVDIQELS